MLLELLDAGCACLPTWSSAVAHICVCVVMGGLSWSRSHWSQCQADLTERVPQCKQAPSAHSWTSNCPRAHLEPALNGLSQEPGGSVTGALPALSVLLQKRLEGQQQLLQPKDCRHPDLCQQHPAAARPTRASTAATQHMGPRGGVWEGARGAGGGRGMHINHYWRTSQLLSQAVACRCSWCSPDINHNSPTIDPFAAAIRKSVLVLSIFWHRGPGNGRSESLWNETD